MTGGYLERPAPSGLADVIEIILDKGIVVDAYVRVSLLGIELLTLDARVVIASVDTYLRFAEATNRLDLEELGGPSLAEVVVDKSGDVVEKVAGNVVESKVGGVVNSVPDAVGDAADSVSDTVGDAIGSVSETVGDAIDSVSDTVGDIAGAVGDAAGKAVDAFTPDRD